MYLRYIKRSGVLLAIANSLGGIIWGANSVVLSIYMLSIGLNPLLIGLVLGAFSLLNALGSLVVGYLADFMDRVTLYLVFSIISGSLVLLLTSKLVWVVAIAYPLSAFFNRYVISSAIMGEFAKRERLSDELFSLSSSLNTIFSVAGSLMASLPTYLGPLGYDLIFIVESLAIFASIPLMLLATRNLSPDIVNVRIEKFSIKDIVRLRSLGLILRLMPEALIGLGAGVIIPLFSLWFYLKFHISIGSISIMFAISNATLSLGILMAPLISRRLGSRVLSVVLLEGVATAILALMPLVYWIPLLMVMFVLRNTLMNMASPLLTSLINELTPREERGRVFGVWNTLSSIPRAVGPSIGGYLMNAGYLDLPLYITSLLYAVAVSLFYVLLRDYE
ncbi:MFS transporter [Vulcanisaeta thermophila]|uniref:MFS transporter n=1 Tax=Vulcanisaeta thermophila TaxID=867917 RepID=UPI0008530DB5|nr:MFS transporter [Vulcanisaeta thermophila]